MCHAFTIQKFLRLERERALDLTLGQAHVSTRDFAHAHIAQQIIQALGVDRDGGCEMCERLVDNVVIQVQRAACMQRSRPGASASAAKLQDGSSANLAEGQIGAEAA